MRPILARIWILFLSLSSNMGWASDLSRPSSDRAQIIGENSLFLDNRQISYLRQKLAFDLKVTLTAEAGAESFLTGDLVYFLHDFFTLAKIKQPIEVRIVKKRSPKLAVMSRDRKVLMLSANSVEHLFVTKLREAAKKQGVDLSQGRFQTNLSYSNELFKQLFSQMDDSVKVAVLESFFSVRIRSEKQYVEFLSPELDRLMSTVMDIPPHVREQMRIKFINRMLYGVSEKSRKGDVLARYSAKSQRIEMFDGAFGLEVSFGEDTLAHELCHALAQGLEAQMLRSFNQLSWSQSESQWHLLPGKTNFVSSYSLESTEEDFAESCGAYMVDPNVLKRLALDKYEFFKKRVFRGIEFDHLFDSILSVQLRALLKEDRHPPQLKAPVRDQFQMWITDQPDKGGVDVKLRIKNVFDDVSGVARISALVGDFSKDDYFFIFLKKTNDPYVYEGREFLNYKAALDLFKIDSLFVSDLAGNESRISIGKAYFPHPQIAEKIRKAKQSNQAPELTFDFDKVVITQQRTGEGTVAQVKLPLSFRESFDTVVVSFKDLNSPNSLSFQLSREDLMDSQKSRLKLSEDENLLMSVIIPASYPSGRFILSAVSYWLYASPPYVCCTPSWHYYFRNQQEDHLWAWLSLAPQKNLDHLIINHQSNVTQADVPEVDVDLLKIKAQSNSDGSVGLKVKVPVRNLKDGTVNTTVKVRGPEGRFYQGSSSGKVQSNQIEVDIKLPRHFMGGTYSIESIEVQEFPVIENPKVEPPREVDNPYGRSRELLRERSIQREIKIEGPKLY